MPKGQHDRSLSDIVTFRFRWPADEYDLWSDQAAESLIGQEARIHGGTCVIEAAVVVDNGRALDVTARAEKRYLLGLGDDDGGAVSYSQSEGVAGPATLQP